MPVLERSLALEGHARAVREGVFHVSDLLTRPAVEIARWHTGESSPDGIPPWLAARGKAAEDAALSGLFPCWRNPEITYEAGDGVTIVGHPDYLEPDGNGSWELGEVKSQLYAEDEAREDLALEQAIAYVSLVQAGARIKWQAPPHITETSPGNVRRVNVILAGLWDIQERTFNVDPVTAGVVAAYLTMKALAIHAAVQDRDMKALETFDAEHPPRAAPEYTPTPVAEGEEGELADELVWLHAEKKRVEARYEELRARFAATLTLERKKLAAPSGGTLTLVAKTQKELDEDAWKKLQGPATELAVKELTQQLQESELAQSLEKARADLEEIRRRCMNATKVPGHVRVYPAKGGSA